MMALFNFLFGHLQNKLDPPDRKPAPKQDISSIIIHEPGKKPRPMTKDDLKPRRGKR